MESQDRLLARAAMLAGEIMLVSGAEIARIEETIHYILSGSGREAQAMVFGTGIFVSLERENEEPLTMIRRVTQRSTNLNRICLVNQVSRQMCDGELAAEEALIRLEEIRNTCQYPLIAKSLSYVLVACFFGIVLGGDLWDCLAAALVGFCLGLVSYSAARIHLNAFCTNALGAFACGIAALLLKQFLLPQSSSNIVIISAIMPLVPGVIFTTAVRDTLNGDYSSGVTRMLEAVVTALAVAAGVGAGMALFGYLAGGGISW